MTLLDYALILWRRKWLVAACTLLGALLALVFHLVMPREYQATALILPPQETGTEVASKLAALAGDLPAGVLGIKNPGDRFVDILKSRKAANALVDRFGLMKRYGTASRDRACEGLARKSGFEVTKGGLIAVRVRDRDPQTAADMANAYVEVLGEIDRDLSVGRAGRERAFLDERLAEVDKDMKTAREAWRAFQEKHRIVAVDEGLKATATVIAELEARRIAKGIEVQVMETVYAGKNPQVEVLREEIKRLGEKLKDISRRGVCPGDAETEGSQWLFPAIEKVPELAMEQLDIERKTRLHAELYKLLVTQREMARIAEAKEKPLVQVVAAADVPDQPAGMGPARKLVLFAMAGFAAGGFWAYLAFLLAARRALAPRPD